METAIKQRNEIINKYVEIDEKGNWKYDDKGQFLFKPLMLKEAMGTELQEFYKKENVVES